MWTAPRSPSRISRPSPQAYWRACRGLRLIAVSRGGPVNIDMNAARERQIRVVNTPGRNASAVAEFTIGAMLAETRLITRGHDSMRRGEWRGDLYRADMDRRGTVGDDGRRHRLWAYRDQSRSHPEGVRLPHPRLRSLRATLGGRFAGRGCPGLASSGCCGRATL